MRMDSSGAMDDTGTYAKVRFDWKSGINGQTALVPTQIKIEMRESGTTGYATVYTNTPTATSGSIISDLIANVDTTKQYDVLVTVTDSMGYGTRSTYVSKAQYIIDVEPSGDGISFGSACSRTGLSTSWDIYMDNNKALYCGGSDKTSWYNMLGSDETNTFHFGYGSYNNNFGNTYYNGNTVNIRSKSDINIQSENSKIVLKSATNNNIVMYPKGGTIAYTLYYAAGMEFDVNVFTAGFVTNSSADVRFTFYFSRPVVNDPIITVSSQSNGGFLLRQDGKYTHGSASTPTYAKPSSYSTICTNNYVRINATFSRTTNAINNTPVGIQWLGHIAFA